MRPHTILICDDDVDFVGALIDTLELDYPDSLVIFAHNVDNAIALISERNGAVDLALIDQIMPMSVGRDLFSFIAANNYPIYCILMTAYSKFELTESTINQGNLSGYMPKPIDQDKLKQFVANSFIRYESNLANEQAVESSITSIMNSIHAMMSAPALSNHEEAWQHYRSLFTATSYTMPNKLSAKFSAEFQRNLRRALKSGSKLTQVGLRRSLAQRNVDFVFSNAPAKVKSIRIGINQFEVVLDAMKDLTETQSAKLTCTETPSGLELTITSDFGLYIQPPWFLNHDDVFVLRSNIAILLILLLGCEYGTFTMRRSNDCIVKMMVSIPYE